MDFIEFRKVATERAVAIANDAGRRAVSIAEDVAARAPGVWRSVVEWRPAPAWQPPVEAEGFEPTMSMRRPAVWGIAAILIGFGGFLVWAFTANLDSAAVASGSVIADSKRK